MQLTAEPELGAVAKAAAGREFGSVAGVLVEVAAEPRLALDKEWSDVPVWVGPTAAARGGHRHHDAAIRMDDDSESARARRPSKGVVEAPARQVQRGGSLGDGHPPMVPRQATGCGPAGASVLLRRGAAPARVDRQSPPHQGLPGVH